MNAQLYLNRMEGHGSYKLITGSRYEGEMKDGMYHGKGEIHFPDGSKYVGNFVKGYPASVRHVILHPNSRVGIYFLMDFNMETSSGLIVMRMTDVSLLK